MMDTYTFNSMRTATKDLTIGSDEWVEGMSFRFQNDFNRMERYGAEQLVATCRELFPYKPWNTIPIDHPSKRADVYIEGITGQPWDVLLQIIKGFDPELATLFQSELNPGGGGDRKSENIKTDNVSFDSNHGNSKSYTLNRLKRDSPDLFNAVISGAMTANSAAIEAGFRKKYYQIEATKEAVLAFCGKYGIEL